jgi:SNF2 family DNA or RNA helicase
VPITAKLVANLLTAAGPNLVLKVDMHAQQNQVYFDLPPKLRAAYSLMEDELRIELETGELETVHALSKLTRLQQITSGFVTLPGRDTPMILPANENPRLKALMQVVPDIQGQFIIWAHFKEELRQIAEAFAEAGITAVEYHGGVGTAARDEAIDDFQKGRVRAFIGQAQAGGTGITLTAAETAVYLSNSFNNGVRVQSEDRCHRIGTRGTVVYIDIAAVDTVDEAITRALQRKSSVAAAILDGRGLRMPAII